MDAESKKYPKLEVLANPIEIIYLSENGLPPKKLGSAQIQKRPKHLCQNLPPRNANEEVLLSIWLNTHQAMFIATGIAAQCTLILSEKFRQGADREQLEYWTDLATNCRLASALYTDLPYLTRERYVAYLRESMKTVHQGFSGVSNMEAIVMESSLKTLKHAFKETKSKSSAYSQLCEPFYEKVSKADKTWWKHHGKAMLKLVEEPISLARLDFKKMQMQNNDLQEFEDYRNNILRESSATKDYDRYFAVHRCDTLTLEDYRITLDYTIENAKGYTELQGIMSEYRKHGIPALYEALDQFKKQLS